MSTKFKPQLVSFNKEAFEIKEQLINDKLSLLDKASVWINKTIPLQNKLNLKRLHLNMVECFKDVVAITYKDVNQLDLSPMKLIEVKDIKIAELKAIQREYDSIELEVQFKDNTPVIKLDRKEFELWTTSEKQNQILMAGKDVISAIENIEDVVKIYPFDIMRGTSHFIQYDIRSKKFEVSKQYLFE